MRNEVDHRFLRAFVIVVLRVLRRKYLLKPADLTELRIALDEGARGETYDRLKRELEETTMDREEKRETPRTPG